MKRIFQLTLLLTLLSCEQSPGDNKKMKSKDIPVTNDKISIADTIVPNNTEKHQTFNETVDSLPENLKTFIPNGYSAINVSTGDANLDSVPDKILVLRKNTEETSSNYAENKPDKRPLLLLLGQTGNTYKLACRNDDAVYCIDCGGAFGDPFTGTTIMRGYFSIEHGISGGQHWEQVTTFKYDQAKANWFLYKDHFISYKLNNSKDENAETLVKETDKLKTVKNFGMIAFARFDIYNSKGH